MTHYPNNSCTNLSNLTSSSPCLSIKINILFLGHKTDVVQFLTLFITTHWKYCEHQPNYYHYRSLYLLVGTISHLSSRIEFTTTEKAWKFPISGLIMKISAKITVKFFYPVKQKTYTNRKKNHIFEWVYSVYWNKKFRCNFSVILMLKDCIGAYWWLLFEHALLNAHWQSTIRVSFEFNFLLCYFSHKTRIIYYEKQNYSYRVLHKLLHWNVSLWINHCVNFIPCCQQFYTHIVNNL